jgi:hypothetical protein
MAHLASGTKTDWCTLSLTGSSMRSAPTAKRTAAMSASSRRSRAVWSSEAKRATLKLVARLTCNTFTGWSGGRKAWGSGLASVIASGSKFAHTLASV